KIADAFCKCCETFRAHGSATDGLPKQLQSLRRFLCALKRTTVDFGEPVIKHPRSLVDNVAGLACAYLGTAKTRIKTHTPQVFGLQFCLRYSCWIQLSLCTTVELLP